MAAPPFRKFVRLSALLIAPALFVAASLEAQQVALESGVASVERATPAANDDVTFAGDVAVILQEKCQICHQPDGIGPMSLLTYEEVRPWAPVIKDLVIRREMPPYHYDPGVGIQEIKNDWRLTDEQIRTISAWVDAGSPMGDPAEMPPPATFTDGTEYQLEGYFGRPPDVVITSTPYDVPAVGSDLWWRPTIPTGITESLCIAGIETKPALKARAVSHHANTSFRGGDLPPDPNAPVGDDAQDDDDDVDPADRPTGRLSEYAMGKIGEIIPPDACRRAPANGNVAWDIHYYPNGEAVQGATVSVGIWLHPREHQPKYSQDLRSYGTASGSGDLEIAPQGTLMTEGFSVWDHPVRIDSWQPHGHLRLVGAKLEVLDPTTGQKELLSMVSNWNAGWHHSHVYEEHVAPLIPAGHVLIRTQWYDNTDNNYWLTRLGGDPDMWVGTGDRTADEMSHQWIAVTHLDQEGYEALLAQREANQPETAGGDND